MRRKTLLAANALLAALVLVSAFLYLPAHPGFGDPPSPSSDSYATRRDSRRRLLSADYNSTIAASRAVSVTAALALDPGALPVLAQHSAPAVLNHTACVLGTNGAGPCWEEGPGMWYPMARITAHGATDGGPCEWVLLSVASGRRGASWDVDPLGRPVGRRMLHPQPPAVLTWDELWVPEHTCNLTVVPAETVGRAGSSRAWWERVQQTIAQAVSASSSMETAVEAGAHARTSAIVWQLFAWRWSVMRVAVVDDWAERPPVPRDAAGRHGTSGSGERLHREAECLREFVFASLGGVYTSGTWDANRMAAGVRACMGPHGGGARDERGETLAVPSRLFCRPVIEAAWMHRRPVSDTPRKSVVILLSGGIGSMVHKVAMAVALGVLLDREVVVVDTPRVVYGRLFESLLPVRILPYSSTSMTASCDRFLANFPFSARRYLSAADLTSRLEQVKLSDAPCSLLHNTLGSHETFSALIARELKTKSSFMRDGPLLRLLANTSGPSCLTFAVTRPRPQAREAAWTDVAVPAADALRSGGMLLSVHIRLGDRFLVGADATDLRVRGDLNSSLRMVVEKARMEAERIGAPVAAVYLSTDYEPIVEEMREQLAREFGCRVVSQDGMRYHTGHGAHADYAEDAMEMGGVDFRLLSLGDVVYAGYSSSFSQRAANSGLREQLLGFWSARGT
jgi:hypothetical protein